jgi:hypothetical protein
MTGPGRTVIDPATSSHCCSRQAQGSSFIAGHSGPDAIEAQDVKRRRIGDPARRCAGFSRSQEFGLEQRCHPAIISSWNDGGVDD